MKKLVLYVIIFFISSHTLLGAVKGILNFGRFCIYLSIYEKWWVVSFGMELRWEILE